MLTTASLDTAPTDGPARPQFDASPAARAAAGGAPAAPRVENTTRTSMTWPGPSPAAPALAHEARYAGALAGGSSNGAPIA